LVTNTKIEILVTNTKIEILVTNTKIEILVTNTNTIEISEKNILNFALSRLLHELR